jgi:hypothetical protein
MSAKSNPPRQGNSSGTTSDRQGYFADAYFILQEAVGVPMNRLRKTCSQEGVGRFVGGRHHGKDALRPVRDQVRRCEFDDTPDAARTEDVMDDD